MAHLTKDPAAAARWITIYPAYLDSSLSIAEGRRLPIAKVGRCAQSLRRFASGLHVSPQAVEYPKITEIEQALKSIGATYRIEVRMVVPCGLISSLLCC